MKTTLVATTISACLTLAVHAQVVPDAKDAPDAKDKPAIEKKDKRGDTLTESRRVAERAFKRADKDKDELLTKEEFRKAAPSIATASLIEKRFAELDRDKDASLVLDEFKLWDEQALRRELKQSRTRDRKGDDTADREPRRTKEPKGEEEAPPTPPAPPRAE